MKYIQIPHVAFKWQGVVTAAEKVMSSKDAYSAMKQVFKDHMGGVEIFVVMCLNTANKPININIISIGGIGSTVADMRVIFLHAIKSRAAKIVLAHNHPSGNLNPSTQDKMLTEKAVKGGKVLDIDVVDHLIITEDGYYSFADEGLI